ncbi:MAG: cation:proton antiporter [Alphaproteobacteria bacterium]|nr:cation:proton antiporter [Alphaproteobacteria bacterium]
MNLATVISVCLAVVAYALFSDKLSRSMLTPPLAFAAFGFAIGPGGLGLSKMEVGHGAIHLIAEATLVLVLFADAARIDLTRLRADHNLPARMLLIGLPLTIVAGAAAAYLLFPSLGVMGALLLAAVLAPTDAALGQAVVSDPEVPVRIRQAINVESGLNDGIALPAVLIFLTLAGAATTGTAGDFVALGILQIAIAPLVGIGIGTAGGHLIDRAASRGLTNRAFEGMAVLALAFGAFAISEAIGSNGFIAAFTAGLCFGATVRHRCAFLFEFMETEGQLLALLTFLAFGAAMLPGAIGHIDLAVAGYAVLSLTAIRMIPVCLSLWGSRVGLATHLFLGWFGPRGLASILFALLIVESSALPYREEILVAAIVTVGLSIIAHGLSAAPLARRYGALAKCMGECEENVPVSEMRLRHGNRAAPGDTTA